MSAACRACGQIGILCQSTRRPGPMPTRNVVLTDYQAEMIERLVASGRYQNASEVLREGLRLVEHQEEEARARLKALQEAARSSVAAVEEGRYRVFTQEAAVREHMQSIGARAI